MANILLVEDDKSLSQLYKTSIELEGYKVDVANEGQKGMEKALSEEYDLIILDIILPNLSGFDILTKLKSDESSKKTRVIMLTNYGQQENVKKAYDLGADDVFLKYRMTPTEAARKIKQTLG